MSEISRFITIIRPEFMTFCQDACRSAALNHLLFRIAYKCKDQPKEKIQAGDILWYAKTELITQEMSNAWGTCKVRKEVNALVDMGLLGRKSNPTWGADRTKHFCFGTEQCQKLIDLCEEQNVCIVHLDLPAEVMHLIYSSNANDKSIKCTCPDSEANDKSIGCIRYNHQMEVIDLSNANDKSIRAIPEESLQKIPTEDTHKEEGTYSAQSAPPASGSQSSPAPATLENTPYRPDQETDERHAEAASPSPIASDTPDPAPSQAHSSKDVAGPDVGYEKNSKGKGGRGKKDDPPPAVFTPEGQKVYDAWASLFKAPPPAGEQTIKCANDLYARLVPWCQDLRISCAVLLKEIKSFLFATATNGFYKRGVTLCDIHRDFEKWQSAKTEALEAEAEKAARKHQQSPQMSTIEVLRAQQQKYCGGTTAGGLS